MSSCQSVSTSSVFPIPPQNNKPKLSPGWGFKINGNLPPYRYDENSICSIACVTFKELAKIHFERDHTMPYLVGIVENESSAGKEKSCNMYDLQELKNWLVHNQFLNPITKEKCVLIHIVALDFFGNDLFMGVSLSLNPLVEITKYEKVEDFLFYKELITNPAWDLPNTSLAYYVNRLIIILNKFPLDTLPVQAQNQCLAVLSQLVANRDLDSENKLVKVIGPAEMNYIEGRVLVQQKLFIESIKYLKRAILLNPNKREYYVQLQMAAKQIFVTEDLEFYELVIATHPYSFLPHRALAILQAFNGDLENALESFSKSFELSKGTNEESIDKFYIANILLRTGHVQRAEEIASEIFEPFKAAGLILYSKIALMKKNYSHALSCIKAIEYERESPGIKDTVDCLKLDLAKQAENLFEEGHLETAEQIAILIKKSFPKHRGWSLLLLAKINIEKGCYELAKDYLEKVDDYSPFNSYKTNRIAEELKQRLDAIKQLD